MTSSLAQFEMLAGSPTVMALLDDPQGLSRRFEEIVIEVIPCSRDGVIVVTRGLHIHSVLLDSSSRNISAPFKFIRVT